MKTYLFSLIDKYKQYSQKMDVQAVLCSKAWYVLNEDGNSEILIFKTDYTGYASVSGDTRVFKWEFLPQNNTLLINHDELKGTMLRPAYFENGLLVCQKDGTQECMFLMDDCVPNEHKIKSLDAVKQSLAAIEQKRQDAILAAKRREEEEEAEQRRRKEEQKFLDDLEKQRETEEKRLRLYEDFINCKTWEQISKREAKKSIRVLLLKLVKCLGIKEGNLDLIKIIISLLYFIGYIIFMNLEFEGSTILIIFVCYMLSFIVIWGYVHFMSWFPQRLLEKSDEWRWNKRNLLNIYPYDDCYINKYGNLEFRNHINKL